MDIKLKIKVCGMKFLSNRLELENLPVDFFGFIFHPSSPRYVGGLSTEEIYRLTDTSKNRVAVFVNAPISEAATTVGRFGFEYIQLHGSETPEYCRCIRESGVKVIKVFHLHPGFSFQETEAFAEVADLFLFDNRTKQWGGSGHKFNWQILENYQLSVPFFLSGGIGPEDAETILRISHPSMYGIDLNSGFEGFPGMKNREKLKVFLDTIFMKLQSTSK